MYSICRIRQFTDTTECLQDEIIVFVNKIVKIIHLSSQHWEGKPTKNYGERYMITWKLPGFENAVDSKEDSQAMRLGEGNLGSQDGIGGQNENGRNQDEDIFGKNVA